MLYMKTRVTFRVAGDLADALRVLPNQTQFVENAVRDALGRRCTACDGTGRLDVARLRVSNFRAAGLPPAERQTAVELRRVVRLARELAATRVELSRTPGRRGLRFAIARRGQVLFDGVLGSQEEQWRS
jgi:hypothetical protein